jgi:uncharacterized integral membrane protein (TIGR00698 family)
MSVAAADTTCIAAPAQPGTAFSRLLPGLLLCGVLAWGGMALGQIGWLQAHGFGALTLAVVLGMIVGNTVYPAFAECSGAGINFAKQHVLRLGIVLYGLRLTVQDIGQVGLTGVAVDALVVCSTFTLACWIGMRWLGLDRKTAMLVGIGSSICGAAAVMAAVPVVKARADQAMMAVATVVVFGTLAIFLYPLLFELNQHWAVIPTDAHSFGLYAGSTIHEVAQVVAVGRSVGDAAADTAVIAKMVRVMMLAPFLVVLSGWLGAKSADGPGRKITVPWFAFGFIAVVLFNSFNWLPSGVVTAVTQFDTALLATAMAALGLTTHVAAIRKAGAKPLLLALVLFVWLIVAGALMNRWVPALLG